MIKCPHGCNVKLRLDKEIEKKGRKNVYKCPKCGCIFSFTIIRMSDKCAEEKRGAAKIQKHSKKKRRRGRPRKNV